MLKGENTGLREDLLVATEEEVILEEITGAIEEVMAGEKEHIQIGEITEVMITEKTGEIIEEVLAEATAAEIILAEKTRGIQDSGIEYKDGKNNCLL